MNAIMFAKSVYSQVHTLEALVISAITPAVGQVMSCMPKLEAQSKTHSLDS